MTKEGLQPSHSTFSTLIDSAGFAGKPEQAEAHFAAMSKYNLRPDTNNYSALIEALARNHQLDKAERVLDSMLQRNRQLAGDEEGARPSAKSFSSLLGFCLARKEWKRASRLAKKLREARIPPDRFLQQQLDNLQGVFSGGRRERAAPPRAEMVERLMNK
jgi:pentatricopeptide repeat protein